MIPSTVEMIPNKAYCSIEKPIIYSDIHDSDFTIKQVREHNAVYCCQCLGVDKRCEKVLKDLKDNQGERCKVAS
jgi:hypothetical protein